MNNFPASCPKCGSTSLSAASIGLKRKCQRVTCLNCGFQYDPTHKRRIAKQKRLLIVVLIICAITIFIASVYKNYDAIDVNNSEQSQNIQNELIKMSGLDKETTFHVISIAKKCGINELKELNRDEMLDGLSSKGSIGYRANTKDYSNICIYLKKNKVDEISYLDNILFSSNKVKSHIQNIGNFSFNTNPKTSKANKNFTEKLSSFRKSTDEVENNNFYYPKNSPKYSNVLGMYIYIANNKNNYTFRIRTQYEGQEWLFCEQYTINIDGVKSVINPSKIYRDNNHRVWEYSDDILDAETISILRKISKSKKTILRYEGSEKYFDRTITSQEKESLKEMLEMYNLALLTK